MSQAGCVDGERPIAGLHDDPGGMRTGHMKREGTLAHRALNTGAVARRVLDEGATEETFLERDRKVIIASNIMENVHQER